MLSLKGFSLGLKGLDPIIAFLSSVGPKNETGVLSLSGGFVAFGDLDGFDDPAPAAVAVEDDFRGGGAFDCLQRREGRKEKGGRMMSLLVMTKGKVGATPKKEREEDM